MLKVIEGTFGYGPCPILKKINIQIPTGEIHVVMGINGAGKSTLLKTLVNVTPLLEGSITIAGGSVATLDAKTLALNISYLESQNLLVFPITVKSLVTLSLRLHGDQKIYTEALDALDLRALENKNMLELSSGEFKRAFIAHALCTKAKIILLDEPLAHLDWSHQAMLVDALKNWRKKFSTTFVLAVHELEWIPKIADQVTALGRGGILAQGDPASVIQSEEVGEVFAFRARIDENPIDGLSRLTLGQRKK
jgi:iron complex transport system ATP-binding protein